jgi:hypothetical protein
VERHRQFRRSRQFFVREAVVKALAVSSLLALLLAAATHLDPVPQGLSGEYFSGTGEAGTPAGATLDTAPSTRHLIAEWHESPPDTFSQRWAGEISVLREGTYTFSADSDADATIVVDGQVIANQIGGQPANGSIHLSAGAHPLLLQYAHHGGPVRFNFLWARDHEPLAPVPGWALRPRKVRSLARLLARAALDRALALSEWVWVGLLVLAAASLARSGLARLRRSLERACAWPALRWILAGSLALNVAGLWWGLPGSWVAIELKPPYIFDALQRHFSNGWYDAYPPLHFYLLAAVWSPLLLLSWLDRLSFDGTAAYTTLVVISRLLSVAMAAGIVAATCVSGTIAFGRRAGLIAAAIAALTTPLLYYAKTANVDVPYLFWWAVSLVFYLRLLESGRLRDYLLFAAGATLSVCTKDQAYGLYLLPPIVIVEQLWRVNRQTGMRHAFWLALADRKLMAAALASAALFGVCHNVMFNLSGFLDHVRYITGPGNTLYRIYEPTLDGHLQLLAQTVRLIELSMGWPLFLAGVAGVAIAAMTPRLRRTALWLVIPVAGYYVGFINVILYNYDRFVMPMCFVLAIFGGLAIDRLLSARRRIGSAGAAIVAGAFAYTLIYAGTVDALMMEDSRYDAERWMRANVGPGDMVAASGLHEYLPRLTDFRLEDIDTLAELRQEHPRFIVLNADYAHAVPPETPWGQLIAGLQHETLGYHLAGRFRRQGPWRWLPGGDPDLVGPRQETIVFSTLRNINPTIEVFQRDR